MLVVFDIGSSFVFNVVLGLFISVILISLVLLVLLLVGVFVLVLEPIMISFKPFVSEKVEMTCDLRNLNGQKLNNIKHIRNAVINAASQ